MCCQKPDMQHQKRCGGHTQAHNNCSQHVPQISRKKRIRLLEEQAVELRERAEDLDEMIKELKKKN